MDEVSSKILSYKLSKIDTYIKKRRAIARIYENELKDTSLSLPKKEKKTFDVFHLYTVYHTKRNTIQKNLLSNKIQTRVIYPYPIHKMKAYKKYFKNVKFPTSEKKSKGIFCLPLYPELKHKDVRFICKILKRILKKIP